MKAKAIFLTNGFEIEQATEMGLDVPEKTFETDDFYFRVAMVDFAYRNAKGNINISIHGDIWTLEWNEKLYNDIIKRLGDY